MPCDVFLHRVNEGVICHLGPPSEVNFANMSIIFASSCENLIHDNGNLW